MTHPFFQANDDTSNDTSSHQYNVTANNSHFYYKWCWIWYFLKMVGLWGSHYFNGGINHSWNRHKVVLEYRRKLVFNIVMGSVLYWRGISWSTKLCFPKNSIDIKPAYKDTKHLCEKYFLLIYLCTPDTGSQHLLTNITQNHFWHKHYVHSNVFGIRKPMRLLKKTRTSTCLHV